MFFNDIQLRLQASNTRDCTGKAQNQCPDEFNIASIRTALEKVRRSLNSRTCPTATAEEATTNMDVQVTQGLSGTQMPKPVNSECHLVTRSKSAAIDFTGLRSSGSPEHGDRKDDPTAPPFNSEPAIGVMATSNPKVVATAEAAVTGRSIPKLNLAKGGSSRLCRSTQSICPKRGHVPRPTSGSLCMGGSNLNLTPRMVVPRQARPCAPGDNCAMRANCSSSSKCLNKGINSGAPYGTVNAGGRFSLVCNEEQIAVDSVVDSVIRGGDVLQTSPRRHGSPIIHGSTISLNHQRHFQSPPRLR